MGPRYTNCFQWLRPMQILIMMATWTWLYVTIMNRLILYRNNAQKLHHSFTIIQLKGSNYNTQAVGAKVYIFVNGEKQFAENYSVRGYQSTVTNKLHFGLTLHLLLTRWKLCGPAEE